MTSKIRVNNFLREEYLHPYNGDIRWGNTGYCTNGETVVEGDFIEFQADPYSHFVQKTSKTVGFGYSHGTEPAVEVPFSEDYKPWIHIAWSKDPFRAEKATVTNVGTYRKPVKAMEGSPNLGTGNCINALENSGKGCSIYPYWNWRVDALG